MSLKSVLLSADVFWLFFFVLLLLVIGSSLLWDRYQEQGKAKRHTLEHGQSASALDAEHLEHPGPLVRRGNRTHSPQTDSSTLPLYLATNAMTVTSSRQGSEDSGTPSSEPCWAPTTDTPTSSSSGSAGLPNRSSDIGGWGDSSSSGDSGGSGGGGE